MAAMKDNLIQEYRNWVRLLILIDYGGGELCLDVLLKKENLASDGVELYKRLEPEQPRLCWFKNQRQVLCPSSEITSHSDFYLTLFTGIIEVMFGSKYESLVKDRRNLRNEECHRGNKELPDTSFDNLWKCTANMLEKCSLDLSLVDDRKDCDPSLDHWFQDIVICI